MVDYAEFEVELSHIEPRVWRRFLILFDATFYDLHEAIQSACGWNSSHLFSFYDRGGTEIAGIPDDEGWGVPTTDSEELSISTYFKSRRKKKILYIYDFGDNWEHDVTMLRVVKLDEKLNRRLLDGDRAFPPEDCGGLPGYNECCRVAENSAGDEEDEARKEWMGDWRPDAFSLEEVKAKFDY